MVRCAISHNRFASNHASRRGAEKILSPAKSHTRRRGFREATFSGFIWKPEPGTTTPEGTLRQGRGVLICRK